jgi:transcriptional regulator with XRE-family HTH domain
MNHEDALEALTPLEAQCARRLRQIRRERGFTLGEIESMSKGEIKSVVLGSYERGTRAISMARLHQLAEFYSLPIEYFLRTNAEKRNAELITFDLRRVRGYQGDDLPLLQLRNLLADRAQQRGDWRGEVITVRKSDLEILAAATNLTSRELTILLENQRLVVKRN